MRVTVWLPRSHMQEAGPGRGREPATLKLLDVSRRGMDERRDRKMAPRVGGQVLTEFMQLNHQDLQVQ